MFLCICCCIWNSEGRESRSCLGLVKNFGTRLISVSSQMKIFGRVLSRSCLVCFNFTQSNFSVSVSSQKIGFAPPWFEIQQFWIKKKKLFRKKNWVQTKFKSLKFCWWKTSQVTKNRTNVAWTDVNLTWVNRTNITCTNFTCHLERHRVQYFRL